MFRGFCRGPARGSRRWRGSPCPACHRRRRSCCASLARDSGSSRCLRRDTRMTNSVRTTLRELRGYFVSCFEWGGRGRGDNCLRGVLPTLPGGVLVADLGVKGKRRDRNGLGNVLACFSNPTKSSSPFSPTLSFYRLLLAGFHARLTPENPSNYLTFCVNISVCYSFFEVFFCCFCCFSPSTDSTVLILFYFLIVLHLYLFTLFMCVYFFHLSLQFFFLLDTSI